MVAKRGKTAFEYFRIRDTEGARRGFLRLIRPADAPSHAHALEYTPSALSPRLREQFGLKHPSGPTNEQFVGLMENLLGHKPGLQRPRYVTGFRNWYPKVSVKPLKLATKGRVLAGGEAVRAGAIPRLRR